MNGKCLRLAAVGDIALTHGYDALNAVKGPHYPFDMNSEVFRSHDVVLGNLEGPFCLGGETYPTKCSLRAHPDYAAGLKQAGFTALSLANNHILDYREAALFDTMRLLDGQGLGWFGAGTDLERAGEPLILEKNDIKIALLGRCEVRIDSPFYASAGSRGIAPLDPAGLAQAIEQVRGRVNAVIVSLHWGKEDWVYPSPDQLLKARGIIDMGADLVLGHHPHVLQGIEKHGRGYIAYSLGNFLFSDIDWRWVSEEDRVIHSFVRMSRLRKQTMILSLDVRESGLGNVRMIPCFMGDDLRVRTEDGSGTFMRRMHLLSVPLGMGRYDAFWNAYDRTKAGWVRFTRRARRLRNIHRAPGLAARRVRTVLSGKGERTDI